VFRLGIGVCCVAPMMSHFAVGGQTSRLFGNALPGGAGFSPMPLTLSLAAILHKCITTPPFLFCLERFSGGSSHELANGGALRNARVIPASGS